MVDSQSGIPKQHEGNRLDTSSSVTASSRDEATTMFAIARKRLLDINKWNELAGKLLAEFKLTDGKGNEVDRLARPDDYFKINIPGPGSKTGDGYDWVRIESINQLGDNNTEATAITVRPAPNPLNTDDDIAHFFNDEATSTFIIERNNLTITASIHGRNEIPNSDVSKHADRIRNSLVALGAASGFSKIEWNALAKNLVKDLV